MSTALHSDASQESSPFEGEGRFLRALRETVLAWKTHIFPPAELQRDAYLSAAVDRADLEQRIRNWERRPTPFWDGA